MNAQRGVEVVLTGLALVVVASILLGQVVGQPVLLSYVETGSMEPGLRPGDGFVAVPAVVAGPVQVGDVVVFDAEEINDGALVTHRVVGVTDAGYVTKGDANPVTDQDGVEPLVTRDRVVAKALQFGGDVVALPRLGVAVTAIHDAVSGAQRRLAAALNTRAVLGNRGLAYVLFGVAFVAYVAGELSERSAGRLRPRDSTRRRHTGDRNVLAVFALAGVLVLLLTASMTVPAGPHTFDVVSSTQNAPGPRVIQSGTTETVRYLVPSNGLLPVVVFLEPATDGISVDPATLYVPSNSVRESIVALDAPAATGYYTRTLVEHRYPAVLPVDAIRALYAVHPWLPILAIDAVIAAGFLAVGLSLVYGTGRVRQRSLPERGGRRRFFK